MLFLKANGTVKSIEKINHNLPLQDGDGFGRSVAGLGDFDEDGVPDMAVGAIEDDDGGFNRGAV